MRNCLSRNASTSVRDLNNRRRIVDSNRQSRTAAGPRVLDCIVEKVNEELLETFRIALNQNLLGRSLVAEVDAGGRRQRSTIIPGLGRKLVEIDRHRFEQFFPRV